MNKLLLAFLGIILYWSAPVFAQENRAFNGTGNNLEHPEWGSRDAFLKLEASNSFADGYSEPGGQNRPPARTISNDVFAQPEPIYSNLGLSDFVWVWGQFMDHDITLVGIDQTEPIAIPTPADDPFFLGEPIYTYRSLYDENTGTGPDNPLNCRNEITAWLDASNVYGSEDSRADYLRTYSGGKMRTSAGNLLPWNTYSGEFDDFVDPHAPGMANDNHFSIKYFLGGDVRANENPLLNSLHTLFVREHNRLCDELAVAHPDWNDEQLFQHARKIVGGLIEAIAYEQWLPSMGIVLPPYDGYHPEVDPAIYNSFSAATFRYGHSTIGGTLRRVGNDGNPIPEGHVALRDAYFNPFVMYDTGLDPLLIGMATQTQQESDAKMVDDLRNFLFGNPGEGGLDLAAVNIVRGRERGLPDYNSLREEYGLSRYTSFNQICPGDPVLAGQLASLYGDIDDIDPWVGALCEDHLPNTLFGPLMTAVVYTQFLSIRNGDRFYYENDPALSPEEKNRIKTTKLIDVIKRNTNITILKNDADHPSLFFARDLSPDDCPDVVAGFSYLGEFNDHKYFLSDNIYQWNAAKDLAETNNGYLASIGDEAENNFLKNHISSMTFIGLNDQQTEGDLVWDSGDSLTYTNFSSCEFCGQNTEANDFGLMNHWDGSWSFTNQWVAKKFIMEVSCGGSPSSEIVLNCPGDITLEPTMDSVVVYWDDPVATTTCPDGGLVVTLDVNDPPSGSLFAPGVYTINYAATDDCGNTASCGFQIVIPEESATIEMNCSGDLAVAATSEEGAIVEFPEPEVTTNCPGGYTLTQTTGLSSGSLFPLGTTVVTFVAEGAGCDVQAQCSFSVTVSESGDCPPAIDGFAFLGAIGDHQYFLSDDLADWAAAKSIAAANGGYLASINSQEENVFLKNHISQIVFIGLNDLAQEGDLQWDSGEPVTYTNYSSCEFCGQNTEINDYGVMNHWDGSWSFTNYLVMKPYLMERVCENVPPEPISVGDLVWDDYNGDGIQDEGEPGIAGVWVLLFDCNDNFISSMATDADGHYLFADLEPGEYKIKFANPGGGRWASPKDAGNDDSIDSDMNIYSGYTDCFTLENGANLTIDGGFHVTGARLAASILTFEAEKDAKKVNLFWSSNAGYKVDKYVVERSADGVDFKPLLKQSSFGGNSVKVYQDVDDNPLSGDNYYHLKLFMSDGSVTYSDVKKVSFDYDLKAISLYPNPASQFVNLDLKTYAGKRGTVKIFNAIGMLVKQKEFDNIPAAPIGFDLKDYRNGIYFFRVKIEGNRQETLRLILSNLGN